MERLLEVVSLIILLTSEVTLGVNSQPTAGSTKLENVLDFLQDGISKIKLLDDAKDVTFVLGNTGSGKSTLTQWIANEENQLTAVDAGHGGFEFIIKDNQNKIGNSTVTSKTTYPELVIDSESNTAYYDFSGFSDTRSSVNDLATSFFIKTVVDHVEKIKIALVVSYPSVEVGVNRLAFKKLLRHTVNLIANIEKYTNSIALIVTKVENRYVRVGPGGNMELVEDNLVIENIVTFIKEVYESIENELTVISSVAEKQYLNKELKLLSALLKMEGQTYSRIGLFRRPEMSGLLSDSPLLTMGREKIKQILKNKINFVAKSNNDFGYTVSAKTLVEITNMVNDLQIIVTEDVKNVKNDIYTNFTASYEQIKKKIETFNLSSNNVDANLLEVQQQTDSLKSKFHNANNLMVNLKEFKANDSLSNILTHSSSFLFIKKTTLSKIEAEENLLVFFQEVTSKKYTINTEYLFRLFKEMLYDFENKISDCDKLIGNLEMDLDLMIKTNITTIVQQIASHSDKQAQKVKDIFIIQNQLKVLNDKLETAQKAHDPAHLMNVLNKSFLELNNKFPKFITNRILNHNSFFLFIKSQLALVAEHLNTELIWHKFLTQFYNHLSHNEMQTVSNRKLCEALLNSMDLKYNGRKVADTNVEFYLKQCSQQIYDMEFNNIKNVTLNQIKINTLYKLLNATINNQLHSSCELREYRLRGKIVKTSDIDYNHCRYKTNMSSINIFASDKIIFDHDINLQGGTVQLNIIAPQWEIIDRRKISLDGSNGQVVRPSKADTSENGKNGSPGGPGGNFLGIGYEFINDEALTISVDGGAGSDGQSGGDGSNGIDGEVPNVAYSLLWYFSLARPRNDVVEDWIRRGFSISTEGSGYCGFPFEYCIMYKVVGKPCTDGGVGGCGGHGGVGGNHGEVKIYGDAKFNVSKVKGRPGTSGLGGNGGRAGQRGGTLTVQEKTECFIIYKEKTYPLRIEDHSTCNDGTTKGACRAMQSYEPQDAPRFIEKKHIVKQYKSFILDNFNELKKSSLDLFISKLDD